MKRKTFGGAQKIIFAGAFAIILLAVIALQAESVEAKSAAYIVMNTSHPIERYITVLADMGFTVSLIDDSNINTTDFSGYDFILIGNENFENPLDIPVNQYPALIIDTYSTHLLAWHWSIGSSSIASSYPIGTNIVDALHPIVAGMASPIQVYDRCCYDSGSIGIPAYFLSRFDKSPYLNTVTAITHNDNDAMIAVATPGTRLRDGVYANAKGVFFGITETRYWTSNAETLFRNSVIWLTRDEVPPVISIQSPIAKSYNTSHIPIEFSSNEPVSCTYSLDLGADTAITSPFEITIPVDGSHSILIRCTDGEGNAGIASVSFSIDTKIPVISINSPQDILYSTKAISVLAEADDPVTQCSYSLNGGALLSLPVLGTGFGTTIEAAEGSNSITVFCKDAAGNTGSASRHFMVDTIAPAISLVSPNSTTIYQSHLVPLIFSISEQATCTYTLDLAGDVTAVSGDFVDTSPGEHAFVLGCEDSAGNTAIVERLFSVDTIAPEITDVTISPTNPTNQDTVTVHAKISDANIASAIAYYRINGGAWQQKPLIKQIADWSANLGVFSANDIVDYYVYAEDSATNHAQSPEQQFSVSESDVTPPSAPINPAAYAEGNTIRLEWGMSSGNAAKYNIYISDNAEASILSFDFSHPNATTTLTSWIDEKASESGRRFYVVRAEDSVGNEEKNNFRFGKFDMSIKQGMNLVSLPLIPFDNSISAVMHESPSSYPIVQVMMRNLDSSYSIAEFFIENTPNYWWSDSGFDEFENNRGYWFKSTDDITFTLTGAVAVGNQNILLNQGMNLVGFSSLSDMGLNSAVSQSPSDYSVFDIMRRETDGHYSIASYFSSNPPNYWWSDSGFATLQPSIGYWFNANKPYSWSYAAESQ